MQGGQLVDGERAEGRIETQGLDEAALVGQEGEDPLRPRLVGDLGDLLVDGGEPHRVEASAFGAQTLAQPIDLGLGPSPFAVEDEQSRRRTEADDDADHPREGVGDEEEDESDDDDGRECHRCRRIGEEIEETLHESKRTVSASRYRASR